MLRLLAARRIAGLPPDLTILHVNQAGPATDCRPLIRHI